MTVLTADELIAMMEKAVEKEGADFKYNKVPLRPCMYFPDPGSSDPVKQRTGCLFGTMLTDAGLLVGADRGQPTVFIGSLLRVLDIQISGIDVWDLQTIQSMQDHGATWGACLEELKRVAGK